MARKRKRAKAPAAPAPAAPAAPAPAPAASSPQAASGPQAESQRAAAAGANPTSPTPQQATTSLEASAAIRGAGAVDAVEQLQEDHEDSSDGLPGIPWALPPPADSDQTDDDDDEQDEEQEQDDQEEEDGDGNGSSDGADGGGPSPLSATKSNTENPWKQHPDRRRKLAGGGAGRDRSNSSSNGAGISSGRRSGRRVTRKALGGGGRGGGGRGRRGEENAGAETGSDAAAEDGGPAAMDGYYGPRAHVPQPCTVFAPREGKVHRVRARGPSSTHAPAALVVGLDHLEQLCFLGAALVRCGRGQADLSGYTLLPAAWGPYVKAHSPRWMGLLVVRALDAEEYSDEVARGSGSTSGGDGVGEADDGAVENEVEEAIDRIAEDFPVVVVLKSLSGDGPLNFLSARADADALYPQAIGQGDLPVAVDHQALRHIREGRGGKGDQDEDDAATTADSSREGSALPPFRLAAELRLPGMQVVMAEEAGLRPFTVCPGWAGAADAVLADPPTAGRGGAVLVCGARGVGKSSFCRFLVNRLLGRHKEVSFLDCDLGQPEFTPPGQVSLHLLQNPVVGPPHDSIRRPRLAYFMGTTTSKPEPLLYSAAVRALAERAGAGATAGAGQQQQEQEREQEQEQEQLSASFFAGGARPPAPLVVNTDGWVKGMGEDLLGAVIDAACPRHIVQILGTSAAKTFELDLSRLPEGCVVHRVEAWSPSPVPTGGPPSPPRPSAQDQRTLRLVAYFLGRGGCGSGGGAAAETADGAAAAAEECPRPDTSAIGGGTLEGSASGGKGNGGDHAGGGGGGGGRQRASIRGGKVHDPGHEVAALLAAGRPRRVPWRAVQIRVMNGAVSPSLALHAMNGALVGLVSMPMRSSERGGSDGGGVVEPPVGGGLICLAETPLAPCVGLGIVRSIDVEKRLLYVLTPEPSDVLKDVNVLVVGSLQLPMVMLYDPNWCLHPYFSSEVVGTGAIKNRSGMSRRGQIG